MQDIVGKIVGGPLGQFADMIASLLENSTVLYGVMGAIAGISLAKLIASLATTAATLASSAVAGGALAAFINPASLIIGIAALATLGALIGSAMTDASEAAQPMGDGFFSKGKTLISTKEGGLFEPSSNDDIAVAPGIGDMINNRPQQTAVVQDNSALLNELKDLNKNTLITNQLVQQSNNKKSDIYMGPDKVGTSLLKSNYSLA